MKCKLLVLVTIILNSIYAQSQDYAIKLNLDTAIEMALHNGAEMRIAILDVEKALMDKKSNNSLGLPSVSLYSNFNHYYAIPKMIVPGEIFNKEGNIPVEFGTKFDWNSGLKFNQLIYSYSFRKSKEIMDNLVSLSRRSMELQRDEVIYSVSSLYYHISTLNGQMAQIDSAISNLERVYMLSIELSKQGVVRRVDADRVKIEINRLLLSKGDLADVNLSNIALLKALCGVDSSIEIEINSIDNLVAFNSVSMDNEFSQNLDLNSHQIEILKLQREITSLNYKEQKNGFMPTISFFGQHYYQSQTNKLDFFSKDGADFYKSGVIGLSVNIPLFDGFLKRDRAKSYLIEGKKIESILQREKMLLDSKRANSINILDNRIQHLIKAKESVDISDRVYLSNLEGYREQTVSLTDLLLSANESTSVKIEYIIHLMNYKQAQLEFKKLFNLL